MKNELENIPEKKVESPIIRTPEEIADAFVSVVTGCMFDTFYGKYRVSEKRMYDYAMDWLKGDIL